MGDNTNRLAGIIAVTIDGAPYDVVGKAVYNVSTVKREGLVGQDGPHGYKETPVFPMMGMSLRDTGGLSVASINAITNSTIVFQLANGKVIVGRQMFQIDEDLEVDTEEGSFNAKFNGFSVTEN